MPRAVATFQDGRPNLLTTSSQSILSTDGWNFCEILLVSTNISLTSAATTNLITVPANREILVSRVIIRQTSYSVSTSQVPRIKVGSDVNTLNIMNETALNGLGSINNSWIHSIVGGTNYSVATDVIAIQVTNPPTGTWNANIELIGYIREV